MAQDAVLRRIERNAVAFCGVMTIAAIAIARGSPWPGIAVVGGGLLIATSYWSIKSGVSGLVHTDSTGQGGDLRAPRARIAIQLAGRYALLALMAYVMIVRLRLHPLGLLAGASSIVAAVTVEAVRVLMKKS
jgi:hypothetical protein